MEVGSVDLATLKICSGRTAPFATSNGPQGPANSQDVSVVHIKVKWDLVESSLVVAMTRLSSTVGYPGRHTGTAPVVLCAEESNCPAVLWLSAGGTSFSTFSQSQQGRKMKGNLDKLWAKKS